MVLNDKAVFPYVLCISLEAHFSKTGDTNFLKFCQIVHHWCTQILTKFWKVPIHGSVGTVFCSRRPLCAHEFSLLFKQTTPVTKPATMDNKSASIQLSCMLKQSAVFALSSEIIGIHQWALWDHQQFLLKNSGWIYLPKRLIQNLSLRAISSIGSVHRLNVRKL